MSQRLQSSHDYIRYKALGYLPHGSSKFKDGDELILGELYCRVEIDEGLLCGSSYKMTGALHTHILKEHRHIKEKPKGPGGNPSNGRVSAARVFYRRVMARHDLSIVPVHRTTPPDESVLQTPLPAIPPEHDIKSEEEFSQLDPQPQVEKRWHFTRNQASSRDEGILPGDYTWAEMENIIVENGGQVPCTACREHDEDSCTWFSAAGCTAPDWFKYQ